MLPVAASCSRWLVIGTVLLTGGHLVGVPALTAPVILAIAGAGFVLGVPHGAVDHVMAARLSRGRPIVLIASAYGGVAAAAWALMAWAGPIALVTVVTLSALHFGLGELEVSRRLTGWRPDRLTAAAIVVAGCGALLLPLARSGDQLSEVAAAVSPGLASLLGATALQIGLVVTWLVAALFALSASLRAGHSAVALDIVLIAVLGMVAPPLVAFAVWFGGWHALRHSARMLTVEPGCAALLADGRRRAAARRLIRLGAWPTVAALATIAALGWFTVAASDPTVVLAEVLRLLLALTVPHMVVVLWLDRTDDPEGAVISVRRRARSAERRS